MRISDNHVAHWSVCLFAAVVLLFTAFPATAEDLTIIDQRGLIRALHAEGEGLRVRLEILAAPAGIQPRLKSIDGVVPDIISEKYGAGSFSFSGLTKGTWQVTGIEGTIAINEVVIEAEPAGVGRQR